MKEMARFEIESATDRSSLCAIFARHGHAVKEMELRNDEHGWDTHYFVVVYEKEDK